MKKIILLFVFAFISSVTWASVAPSEMYKANQAAVAEAMVKFAGKEYSYSNVKAMVEASTHKKLSLKEKIALTLLVKKAKKQGMDIKNTKGFEFKIGGFFLGFFLGLIGVLIAYLALSKEHGTSSLIGLGVGILLYVVFLVLVFA
jgi:uncharacterized membrane protein